MKKVSVVVPAYCPGDGIDRVVRSLAAQSMASDDFEAIIVDDGSPDDTWERLNALAAQHSFIRLERIENSGWPSRPRNVGMDLAAGEYVLFMDHDDELFPEGLQASYDFAVRNGADVLSPKECKTSDISWGISNYTSDIANARPKRGISSLLPMMPHKFYRTAFLRDHGIRFPEGRRMFWEDVYFNVAAYRYAEVISILSSVPVYLWVQTAANNSATYGPWEVEFWEKIKALLVYIHATLPGEEFSEARNSILAHQYNTRVIGRFVGALARDDDRSWVPMAIAHVKEILTDLVPAALDSRLPPSPRASAHLMRADRFDLLDQLRAAEGSWVGLSTTDGLAWDDEGTFVIESTARWNNKLGQPLPLTQQGDRLLRCYPTELAELLPVELRDVTDAVWRANSQVTVRDKDRSTTWNAPTSKTVALEQVPGTADRVTPVVRSVATVDLGSSRPSGTWQIHARNSVLGYTNHRAVHAASLAEEALIDGRVVTPRRDKQRRLSFVIDPRVERVGAYLNPVASLAVFTAGASGVEFSIPLEGRPSHGTAQIPCTLSLTPARPLLARVGLSRTVSRLAPGRAGQRLLVRHLPATIVTDDHGTRLEGLLKSLPGSYGLAWKIGEESRPWPGMILHVPVGRLPRLESAR